VSEFRVTYWCDLPSLVTARDGERTAKAPLDARFMIAIDEAAMRLGATDSDAYLEGWRQSEWEERAGSPEAVAQAVAAELESEYGENRVQEMLDTYGS
jgi:cvfA/B/C family virulence factor